MKNVLMGMLMIGTFSSVNAMANSEEVLEDVVVSCIRVVENGASFHDVEPELFFWNEAAAERAEELFNDGYKLKRGLNSDVLCGSYTPNIEVESRDRQHIEEAINTYKSRLEDGHKVWTTDIVFKK